MDLNEVVWRPDGRKILESHDPKNPYYRRGHMSAAWGYKIAREWPVKKAVVALIKIPKRKPRDPAYARMGRAD